MSTQFLSVSLGDESIRVVEPADAQTLRANCLSQLSLDAVREQIVRDLGGFARGEVVPLVAVVDSAVIGMATLRRNSHPRSRHRAEISPIVVTGPYQRRGWARRLIEALRLHAATLGVDQIEIGARAGSPAEEVYRRLGFVEWGRLPNAGKDAAGKPKAVVYLSMPVAPATPAAEQDQDARGVDLEHHWRLLLERVLPEYAPLGALAWVHVQGSLALGYTDESDLDVILVWGAPEVPTGRESLVARLDERQREFPEAIDYSDIHIDRFVIGGQEYELAHYTLTRFEETMKSVRTGTNLPGREIVNPEALAAAFREAIFVVDPRGLGQRLQETLQPFPEHYPSPLPTSSGCAPPSHRARRSQTWAA